MALRYDTKTGMVEADTPDELVAAVRGLGQNGVRPRRERARRGVPSETKQMPTSAPAPSPATPAAWTPAVARAYFNGVRPTTRAALILLVRNPDGLPSSTVAKQVGMNSARGIGSLFNGIKRGAEKAGMPNPLVVVDRRESGLPVAKLRLDPGLIAAATPILDDFGGRKEGSGAR